MPNLSYPSTGGKGGGGADADCLRIKRAGHGGRGGSGGTPGDPGDGGEISVKGKVKKDTPLFIDAQSAAGKHSLKERAAARGGKGGSGGAGAPRCIFGKPRKSGDPGRQGIRGTLFSINEGKKGGVLVDIQCTTEN